MDDRRVYVSDPKLGRVQVFHLTEAEPARDDRGVVLWPYAEFMGTRRHSGRIEAIGLNKADQLLTLEQLRDQWILSAGGVSIVVKAYGHQEPIRGIHSMVQLPDHRLVITDPKSNRLHWIKVNGAIDFQFGERGREKGQLNAPTGLAVSEDGFIFVADTQNDRIQVFSQDGIFLKAFGRSTESLAHIRHQTGLFNRPTGLAFDSENFLYVVDSGNQRVQVFNVDGRFFRMLPANDAVSFEEPVAIAIDERDFVYVADRGANAVKIFDGDGNYVTEFGAYGIGDSQFQELHGLMARGGSVYVHNPGRSIVQTYRFIPECLDVVSCQDFVMAHAGEEWNQAFIQPRPTVINSSAESELACEADRSPVQTPGHERDNVDSAVHGSELKSVEHQPKPETTLAQGLPGSGDAAISAPASVSTEPSENSPNSVKPSSSQKSQPAEETSSDRPSYEPALSAAVGANAADSEVNTLIRTLYFYDAQYGISPETQRLWSSRAVRYNTFNLSLSTDEVESVIQPILLEMMIEEMREKLNLDEALFHSYYTMDEIQRVGDDRIRIIISFLKSRS
jgi:DNA-binding beta-propeller fold protein YncE